MLVSTEELRQMCHTIVNDQGRTKVAELCGVSPQAIGKALVDHPNPAKYMELRMAILATGGSYVQGPLFKLVPTK